MAKIDKNTLLNPDLLVWFICAMYASLFFPIAVSNFLLVLLLIFCAMKVNIREIIASIKDNAYSKIILLMYLAQIIGLIYTTNYKTGFFMLEKKLSFLLIPILLIPAMDKMDGEKLEALPRKLGLITVLSSVVLLIVAVFRMFALGYTNAFSFESFRNFEGFTSIHYVYYAMYFTCGSLMLIENVFDDLRRRKFGAWIIFGLFVYCLGIITLVASKTGIATFVIVSLILAYYKIKSKKILVGFFLAIIVALSVFLYFNKTTASRFSGLTENLSVLTKDNLVDPIDFNDLNMRLLFWRISVSHLIKDHLVFTGVGTGDTQDYIDHLYNLPIYQLYGYIGWDSHNQWVYTFLQLGLWGMLVLSFLFFFAFREAAVKRDVNFLIFLATTFLFSQTESILESNKGIVFFALLLAVFGMGRR